MNSRSPGQIGVNMSICSTVLFTLQNWRGRRPNRMGKEAKSEWTWTAYLISAATLPDSRGRAGLRTVTAAPASVSHRRRACEPPHPPLTLRATGPARLPLVPSAPALLIRMRATAAGPRSPRRGVQVW